MTTLLQVLNAAEYDLTTKDDAIWLLSRRNEFEELIEEAEDLIYKLEEEENDGTN